MAVVARTLVAKDVGEQGSMTMSTSVTESRRAIVTHRWVVDPSRSTIEFRVKTFWGLKTVSGRFTRFGGIYTAVDDGATIELVIDADSLDTGNTQRDRHLRGTDFFHVERHPHVHFTSVRVRDLGNGKLWVEGELEAVGKTVPVSFEASRHDVGDDLEIDATTTVDQRLLGMTHSPLGMLLAPSSLHVKARLTRAPEARRR
jgi:polyisoprenoid-binding protein YceI